MVATDVNVCQDGRAHHARQTSMNVKLAVPVCMMVYVRIQTVAMSVAAKRSGVDTAVRSMSTNACRLLARIPESATMCLETTSACVHQVGLVAIAPSK